MRKLFALHPGKIFNEGELHFVSGDRLAELYELPKGSYLVWDDKECKKEGLKEEDFIHLHPKFDGVYELPKGVRFKSKEGNELYALSYQIIEHAEGVTRKNAGNDAGVADSIFIVTKISDPEKGVHYNSFGFDGISRRPMGLGEVFRIWAFISKLLAEQMPLDSYMHGITKEAYALVKKHMKEKDKEDLTF